TQVRLVRYRHITSTIGLVLYELCLVCGADERVSRFTGGKPACQGGFARDLCARVPCACPVRPHIVKADQCFDALDTERFSPVPKFNSTGEGQSHLSIANLPYELTVVAWCDKQG